MTDISIHVNKLAHYLEEIRIRALNNIISKLGCGLLNEERLIDQDDLFLNLIKWFSFNKVPEKCKVLCLILRLVKNKNGAALLLRADPGLIKLKNVGGSDEKILIDKICEIVLPEFAQGHHLPSHSEVNHPTPGCIITATTSTAVNPKSDVLLQGVVTTNNDCSTEKNHIINCNAAKEKITKTVPTQSSSSDQCQTVPNISNLNAFKKINSSISSTFSFNVNAPNRTNQIINDGSSKGDDNSTSINQKQENSSGKNNNNKQKMKNIAIVESDKSYDTSFCVWILPWQKLVKPDGHVLTAVENSLKNSVMIEHTCQFFTTVMLHDYPPEVFLQRRQIMKNMLHLAGNGSCPAINALSEFVKLLYNRILFFLDPSTSCLKLEGNPLSPNSSDVSPSSKKEGSFPDNVAFHQYKEERRKVSNQIVSDIVIAGVDQLAVPQFCAAALLSVVPFCGQIEGVAAPLFVWLIKLLEICIHDYYSLWSSVNIHISVIRQQLYNTMVKFAEALSKSMSMEPINRMLLIISVNQFIKSLVPLSIASSCIPLELQSVLIELLIDPAIILLYNNLHKNLLLYVQSFKKGGESDYNVIKVYYKSMKSSLKFLHDYKTLTTEETVKLFKSALPSLVLHQRLEMIKFFIDCCNEKFVDKNTEEATMILVTLLAHVDRRVCLETYSACHEKISTFLGPEQATKGNDPFPKLKFFINAFVLREIICHGLINDDKQVQNYSQEIMVLLLKCQMLVSEQSWLYIWSEITPVLPLLQSFAEKETPLGDTVIEMFNPDVAKTVGMGELQVLLGNIRFMMSNNEYCRVEAVARVMWLINITIKDGTISNICFIDKCITKKQKLCGIYETNSMIRVVEVLKCQTIDQKILQSVLAQLSVMSDDPHLHGAFMDEDGLKIVINLLQSFSANHCDERKIVLHIITTLKNLARHSSKIRLQLCEDLIALKCIVKCLFMYHNRWRLQRDSAQLLALIVFAEFFVTTPDSVSLPYIIVSHFRIPFECATHWNVSPNSQPTLKGSVIHKKKNLNILSILWLALESDNILNIDKPSTHINPDMNVKLQDLRQVQGSAVGHNCKKLLNIIQTAKSHKDVHIILTKLMKFLEVCNYQEEIKDEIQDSHLWRHTFMKFLSVYPLSVKDEKLLHAILQFLKYVIVIMKPQIKWLSDLLTNPFKPMLKLLTSYSDNNREKGLILWKELLMSLLELCGDCCKLGNSTEVCWNGLTVEIIRCLHHTQTQHFYNLAFLGTILNCLSCILTAREGVTEELRCDILWKLLAAFHYGTPNSCMGLRITRQTLLILNNLLHLDLKNKKSNKWDENWLKENNIIILSPLCRSRDIIVRAATLQLISGICTEKHSATILLEYIPSLWNIALSIILDHDEASIVREQAAVVCTNIICHNKQEIYLSTIFENNLFSQLKRILGCLVFEKIVWNKNKFILPEDNDSEVVPTTPNFIKAISSFITTLLAVYPVEVADEIKNKNLIISFIRCLLKMNLNEKHISLEVCNMCSLVCTLLHSCISLINSTNIPPDLITVLIKLLNHSNYGTDESSVLIRDKLWGNVLILLSVIPQDIQNCDNIVFPDYAVETICYCLDENTNQHLQQQAMMSVAVICSFFNIENSKQVCEKLILLWDKSILTKRKKPLIEALTSLLGRSKEASETALRMGLLQLLIHRLRNVLVTLAIETGDTSRLRKGNPLLAELSLYLGLSCNFLFHCPNVKISAANAGFADTLHKLWVWCLADIQIFLIALQTLITFTADNPLGARSMLLTSTTAGVGQRKTPSSFSLVHAVINLITTNKEHYPIHVIHRAFLLLTHSCQTPEARAIIAKSNLINKFDFGYHKKVPSDDVEGIWLKFLMVFSYYPEGQLAIPKNKDAVEQLIELSASNKSSISYAAISVLRNISFHSSNRPRLLTSENFLSHLGNRLNTSDSLEEKKAIVAIIWAMVANNQKAKLSVRSAGLDIRLQLAAAMIPYDSDSVELFDYVASLIVPNLDHKVTAT